MARDSKRFRREDATASPIGAIPACPSSSIPARAGARVLRARPSSASSSRRWRSGRSGASSRVARGRRLEALCHAGANLVPSGEGCARSRTPPSAGESRMIIGEEASGRRALGRGRRRDAGAARGSARPARLRDRRAAAGPADTGLRPATVDDLERLAAGVRGRAPRSSGSTRASATRTASAGARTQIEDGRSWLWLEDDVILFKAEASAWTPRAVQVQQVWVDPDARGRGLREARATRPLPARCSTRRRVVPVRAHRQPAGDPALRVDRDAAACSRTGASSFREARLLRPPRRERVQRRASC